jgi:trans-aconitate 2-methyltransferase
MSEVVEFYDEFSQAQAQTGINNRHLSILYHLEKVGLKKNDNVLEVGCGIGTVSQLILRSLSSTGKLLAVDISPKSIDLAQQLHSKYNNATFRVMDLTKETLRQQFDVIVLPDVLEHIPQDAHESLFANLKVLLKDDGFIFVHIPDPNYLQSLIDAGDKTLQIIEIPVYTDQLLDCVYPLGFYLHYLKSYSVYTKEPDYQILILKKRRERKYEHRKTYFQYSLGMRVLKKLSYILRGFK